MCKCYPTQSSHDMTCPLFITKECEKNIQENAFRALGYFEQFEKCNKNTDITIGLGYLKILCANITCKNQENENEEKTL